MIGYGVARIDLLQRTMVKIFGGELGIPVVWGRSDLSRLPRPFARFELLSGPTRIQVQHERRVEVTESDYIVDIPSPVEGDSYLIRVNGVPLRHTATATETQESLRDVFIGLVNGDREPATASAESATQMRVTEAFPGSLPYLNVGGQFGLEVAGDSVQQCAKIHYSRSEVTYSMQIYGDGNEVGTARSAGDLMGMVPLILDLDRTRLELQDQRITLNDIAGPTDISEIEGGGAANESRHTLDLAATITTMYAEVIPVIETIDASVVVDSTEIPISTPAP